MLPGATFLGGVKNWFLLSKAKKERGHQMQVLRHVFHRIFSTPDDGGTPRTLMVALKVAATFM